MVDVFLGVFLHHGNYLTNIISGIRMHYHLEARTDEIIGRTTESVGLILLWNLFCRVPFMGK